MIAESLPNPNMGMQRGPKTDIDSKWIRLGAKYKQKIKWEYLNRELPFSLYPGMGTVLNRKEGQL